MYHWEKVTFEQNYQSGAGIFLKSSKVSCFRLKIAEKHFAIQEKKLQLANIFARVQEVFPEIMSETSPSVFF